eukprot:SAG31_NODE_15310_length_761_cov_0.880665_1_plen_111_part_01
MAVWLLSIAVALALLAFPVRAGEEDEVPVTNKLGRVTRWWWDLHSPKVTTLNDKTFDDFIARKDFTMVEFFLPTCKHCNEFSTSYNRLATTLTSERQDVQFAKVNCGKDQS